MPLGLSGNNIKVKLGTEKDCVQSVVVEMPAAQVKENIEKAYKGVQNQAKLPGFRPGKSPIDLIRKTYQETAFARAQDSLLRNGVTEALKIKNIQAIQPPVITSVNFDPEKPFQFEFTVEVAPKFKLMAHKGIKVEKKVFNISDDKVLEEIKKAAKANAKLVEVKSEIVERSHHVNINYEGFVDGNPIEGTKTENFLLDLSAPQAISGLAEGIEGMKKDEEKDIVVTFPDNSPAKELAGKKAIFKVKVLTIKQQQVPELNDEFAKDLGLNTFKELEQRVKDNMEKEAENKSRRELEKNLIDKLLDTNKFSVPKGLIEKQASNIAQRQRYRMMQQGILKENQDKILEQNKAETQNQAEREVRLAYVLNAVADQEKITVSEKDVEDRINEIVAQSPEKERPQMEQTLRGPYKDQIRSELKDTKIFNWLIDNAKIKNVSGVLE